MPNTLYLPVKREFFEQILSGDKTEEYRLYNAYWRMRIEGKSFGVVTVALGYPSKEQADRTITMPWRGYEIKTIVHPHFGDEAVQVFAIKLEVAPC